MSRFRKNTVLNVTEVLAKDSRTKLSANRRGTIANKILLYIILFSSCITVLITVYQLYVDFEDQRDMVDLRMPQIEQSYRDSLGNATWFFNAEQLESILAGMLQFEDVHFVSVRINNGDTFELGVKRLNNGARIYESDVKHSVQGNVKHVGRLTIESNLDHVIQRLKKKFWLILVSQGLKTFCVSFFILFIIYYLVARHLVAIAAFAESLSIEEKTKFLTLGRQDRTKSDEFDQIVHAMNKMKRNLIQDADEKEQDALKLRKLSQAVEHSSASILIVDSEHKIEYANPKFLSSTGYSSDEVTQKQSNVFCFGKKRAEDYSGIWEKLSSEGEWRGEISSLRKNGETFWESASASIIKGADQAITHYVILKDDVSELRKLKKQLELERDYLREELNSVGSFGEIVGSSDALKKTMSQVEAVANTPASVFILGESGVGKEMIARAVHNKSARADNTMVKVNCASIPNELFESEFFGHIKGSFTGAYENRIGRMQLADKGTLFLDEVGEIPISQQGKLLRALQEGEFERVGDNKTICVNVRVIAATNRDMKAEIKAGRFREDLYYRLSVFPIEVPPLRERRGDIVPLALHLLEKACRELNKEGLTLSKAQLLTLKQYQWPGNIRELENTIERAVISSVGSKLRLDSALLSGTPVDDASDLKPTVGSDKILTSEEFKELEKRNIIAAMEKAQWKTWGEGGAAKLLGMKPSTLAYQIKSLGIEKPSGDTLA